jgi:ubiquinone/menaquinone biosynthesis C-methylase UbiE
MPASKAPGYIHGYEKSEQDRLYGQARFLAPIVFAGVDFSDGASILEVGCGVGAQTRILLDRFPSITIRAVDISGEQVARARQYLASDIERGRVTVDCVGESLPFPSMAFGGAFLSWVLEHTPNPLAVLREARRVMGKGAVLYGIEVMNSSLYIHPACPATMRYWDALNDRQIAAGGDPFVGAKIGNLIHAAGFVQTETTPVARFFDQRDPAGLRRQIDYCETLMLSARPQLEEAGVADAALVREMRKEFGRVKRDPTGVFYYAAMKVRALAR